MRLALWALVLLISPLAVGRAAAGDKGTADPDDVKLVQLFLKTPTSDLPQEAVPHFLEIDPESLPKKLQEPYKGKRLELYTLKQMSDNKRQKGMIRSPSPTCDVVGEAKSQDIRALLMAGYVEIEGDDVACLMKKTHCTEHGLMCEFSLQIVEQKKKGRRYFLYGNDPLMIFLAECRPGAEKHGNSNFFSAMKPSCTE